MSKIISTILNSTNSNICGSIISTSNLSTGSALYSSATTGTWNNITSNYNYSYPKYNIFGEEVEVESSSRDPFLAQNLSLINVLGKPFYDELIKNGFVFTEKVDKILQKHFKIQERDNKIKKVLGDQQN